MILGKDHRNEGRFRQGSMAKKCLSCGLENPDHVHYCGKCGAELVTSSPSKTRTDDLSKGTWVKGRGMDEFLHRRAIVALAGTSMVLLALSLLQPWFMIHDSYTNGVNFITWENDMQIHTRYYTYVEDISNGFNFGWYFGSFHQEGEFIVQQDSRISDLMGFVNDGLLLCIGLVWLLMMAALLNYRLVTFILTWITTADSMICVIIFSSRVPGAVRASGDFLRHWPTDLVTGLFGQKAISSTGIYLPQTDLWSWQPGWGWALAIVAGLLLLATVILIFHSNIIRAEEERFMLEMESSESPKTEMKPDTDSGEESPDRKGT
jgi:hypothetical protein